MSREPYYEGEGCDEWETEQLVERARWRHRVRRRLLQFQQERPATREEILEVVDELNRRFP